MPKNIGPFQIAGARFCPLSGACDVDNDVNAGRVAPPSASNRFHPISSVQVSNLNAQARFYVFKVCPGVLSSTLSPKMYNDFRWNIIIMDFWRVRPLFDNKLATLNN